MMVVKESLQEFADNMLADEYRQPLKTVEEACTAVGWVFEERPQCCGSEVAIISMLGHCYHASCKKCGRFIHDVAGPSFTNSAVRFLDSEKVDLDTEHRWIAGQDPDSA